MLGRFKEGLWQMGLLGTLSGSPNLDFGVPSAPQRAVGYRAVDDQSCSPELAAGMSRPG